MSEPVLSVRNLRTSFFVEEGEVKAVDDVSFDVFQGKTLGIVGESGCGKSVTSLSIMRLLAEPPGKVVGGQILYKGRDLLKLGAEEMRKVRGNEISMIFQEPMTSLNPVFTIGNQIGEAIELHQRGLSGKEVREKTVEALKLVGIPSPEKRIDDYPHQLSGGMRQRVMIAMALSCNPNVLIADEPTTALDVTIQAQILDLLRDLQQKVGLGLILITHDLGVVAEMAEEVLVMYAGRVVEKATAQEIFANPKMPYTRALLNSIPKLNEKKRLEAIPGIVPNLLELPRGCRFQDRCKYVIDECRGEEPGLRTIASAHEIRCVRDI
jgi:oligopeptide/dipeptide ABC transporter ATP-binding protein